MWAFYFENIQVLQVNFGLFWVFKYLFWKCSYGQIIIIK